MAALRDVAKKAGVSASTVSRVINRPDTVPTTTKSRVLKAIKNLNYHPNKFAQRLRSHNVDRKLVGLLVPDIQNPFYVDVVKGVEDYCFERGYAVLMGNFMQDEKKGQMYLEVMQSEEIDGLIVAPIQEHQKTISQFKEKKIPIICIDRGLKNIDVDVVLVENEEGAYQAVDHLIKKGHTRIAYVGGIPSIPTTLEREKGYSQALLDNGLSVDDELIKYGDSTHLSGKKLTEELLQLKDRPTALFTGNNLITLGALETIHKHKLHIPGDIAIIGFDDMPWSISLNPPLSAVSQPGYDIGKRAAELLFQRISDPERAPVKVVLKTKLILRESG